jgi:hypothetical protein
MVGSHHCEDWAGPTPRRAIFYELANVIHRGESGSILIRPFRMENLIGTKMEFAPSSCSVAIPDNSHSARDYRL